MVSPMLVEHELNIPDENACAQAAEAALILDRYLRENKNDGGVTVLLKQTTMTCL